MPEDAMIDGLGQVARRAMLDGQDRRVEPGPACQQDHRDVRIALPNGAKERNPVASRHVDVAHHQIELDDFEHPQRFIGVRN